jgi:hypothetical protein
MFPFFIATVESPVYFLYLRKPFSGLRFFVTVTECREREERKDIPFFLCIPDIQHEKSGQHSYQPLEG